MVVTAILYYKHRNRNQNSMQFWHVVANIVNVGPSLTEMQFSCRVLPFRCSLVCFQGVVQCCVEQGSPIPALQNQETRGVEY